MALIKRKRKNRINEKGRLIISASFLLITIAVVPVLLKYYVIYQNEKRVQEKIDNFFEEQEVIKEENAEQEEQEEQEDKEEIKNTNIDNYILVLDIPKLNLMRGIYDKDSTENDVNRNVKILKESDMPDKINGNLILVAHSGTSSVSYFKNLHKLSTNDIAYIHYMGKVYTYKLVNTYDIEKTGEATIIRNSSKNTLTLITCRRNTNKQTVFIFELKED